MTARLAAFVAQHYRHLAKYVVWELCGLQTHETISSPEPSLPLSSGTGKRSTLGKSVLKFVLNNRILVIPVKLRRREVLMQDGV